MLKNYYSRTQHSNLITAWTTSVHGKAFRIRRQLCKQWRRDHVKDNTSVVQEHNGKKRKSQGRYRFSIIFRWRAVRGD